MHTDSIERWQHEHVFLGATHTSNERKVRLVVGLILVMMVGEIVAGTVFGSMALLADGWHMAIRAGALELLRDIQDHFAPGGRAIINVLIDGTTYSDMFQPGGY